MRRIAETRLMRLLQDLSYRKILYQLRLNMLWVFKRIECYFRSQTKNLIGSYNIEMNEKKKERISLLCD